MPKKATAVSFCLLGIAAIIFAFQNRDRAKAADSPALRSVSPMVKVFKNKTAGGANSVSIKAAKNEYESFQAAITAPSSAVSITGASMSALSGPNGASISASNAELFRVEQVNISRLSGSTVGASGSTMEGWWTGPDKRAVFDSSYWTTGDYHDPLIPFINPVTGAAVARSTGAQKYALPIDIPAN